MYKINSPRQFVKLITLLAGFGLFIAFTGPVHAYSCNAEFAKAEALIKEAEGLLKPDTDSRILALIEQARGVAMAGIISHRKASERHIGATGKYAHGQAVSKGRQAQSIAKEALFLLTGETR